MEKPRTARVDRTQCTALSLRGPKALVFNYATNIILVLWLAALHFTFEGFRRVPLARYKGGITHRCHAFLFPWIHGLRVTTPTAFHLIVQDYCIKLRVHFLKYLSDPTEFEVYLIINNTDYTMPLVRRSGSLFCNIFRVPSHFFFFLRREG